MAFFEDDLDVFFDEFSVNASTGSEETLREFPVIFDESSESYDSFSGKVITTGPGIKCKTSDTIGLKKGDVLSINGKSWKIATPLKPDGTGLTQFNLQESV